MVKAEKPEEVETTPSAGVTTTDRPANCALYNLELGICAENTEDLLVKFQNATKEEKANMKLNNLVEVVREIKNEVLKYNVNSTDRPKEKLETFKSTINQLTTLPVDEEINPSDVDSLLTVSKLCTSSAHNIPAFAFDPNNYRI